MKLLKIFIILSIISIGLYGNSFKSERKTDFTTYLNIDKIATQYRYYNNDSLFFSFEVGVFPLEFVSPAAYWIDEDLYHLGDLYEWNIWSLISGTNGKPYQFKIFHGVNKKYRDKKERIRGNFISYSAHSRFDTKIYALPLYEIGYENKCVQYYSETSQVISKIQLSFSLFGKDFDEQVIKAQYIKKGMIPDFLPLVDMNKLVWKTRVHWSITTRFDRNIKLYVEKPYFINLGKYYLYLTCGIGAKVYMPYIIYKNNIFQVESSSMKIDPVINAEFYFPYKQLFF